MFLLMLSCLQNSGEFHVSERVIFSQMNIYKRAVTWRFVQIDPGSILGREKAARKSNYYYLHDKRSLLSSSVRFRLIRKGASPCKTGIRCRSLFRPANLFKLRSQLNLQWTAVSLIELLCFYRFSIQFPPAWLWTSSNLFANWTTNRKKVTKSKKLSRSNASFSNSSFAKLWRAFFIAKLRSEA